MTKPGIRIAIDRGGTFTDCIGNPGTGRMSDDVIIKLLSEDPANYSDAPQEGIRRILSQFLGKEIARGQLLDTSAIESIRMGTTVATNALLERQGERFALVVTKGFKDCLRIGNQSRPRIFDLAIQKPEVLYDDVIEIDERVTLEEYAEDPDKDQQIPPSHNSDLVQGASSETIRILRRPNEVVVARQLRALYDEGFRSLAVCLLHGYTFHDHETLIGRIARSIGFSQISLSHELMPMIKYVPRATSTCADAYLTPAIQRYIHGFQRAFEGGVGSVDPAGGKPQSVTRCEFMQSDGGLVDVAFFSGLRAILSGPAGGVVGYARTSYDPKTNIPVIGFDMGGTSTDVSRYGSGRFEHVFETNTAGIIIQSPQLDINTVAAGGGSRLFYRNNLFVVGPQSAGAHPGPACYRKDGPLTLTDCNLVLGRLLPEFFPKVFGLDENQGLDLEASTAKFEALKDEINASLGKDRQKMTVDEIAYGFVKVANETMCRPIRSLTEAKGLDTSKHRLATFGGAGGQHAVAIAEILGISQILSHRYSSVLSAYGLALADVVVETQIPEAKTWSETQELKQSLEKSLTALQVKSGEKLVAQGFSRDSLIFEDYLNMRYDGTEAALMIGRPDEGASFGTAFVKQHEQEYGFTLPNRSIVVDDIRVRAIGRGPSEEARSVDTQLGDLEFNAIHPSKRHGMADVYFEGGRQQSPIYKLASMRVGDTIQGPAILADETQTILVTPDSSARMLETHVVIDLAPKKKGSMDGGDSPIMLSIFANRFMAIAEQMGRALQKTSVSTNVKERLDYSCALFDAQGGLVANAPHLPVHLGSMSTCVARQASMWRDKLDPGDVLVTNSPNYGGTHLPDITVITPAFDNDTIVFYVASRAHHADIGGICPGSMPPHSRELFQEGAVITSEKLVAKGKFDENRMTQILQIDPAQHPGCSGTRCLADNINDLKAQVAANRKGINLISSLIEEYGTPLVHHYMHGIQANAEHSVRSLLRSIAKRYSEGTCQLEAEDHMDDGSPIKLRISIDAEKGEAIFDFSGTGKEVYGNINAPAAVTHSAIIYCLRSMIQEDIPLNQGCLSPIQVLIPPGSFLSPSADAAVVGGNVLTSQRVTDVILRCFKACAASQGDCNNLTFGIEGSQENGVAKRGFGYYETIGGGSGAGPDWDGSSGVHTHMTNTRITDSEVFEKRYPVILRGFSLRHQSAGLGLHPGGEGIIRDIEFRIPVQVSILSERRVFRPYGLEGGGPGQCGMNYWVRTRQGQAEESWINLGGKNSVMMQPGDRIVVCTPGGGAWGALGGEKRKAFKTSEPDDHWRHGSVCARSQAQLSA